MTSRTTRTAGGRRLAFMRITRVVAGVLALATGVASPVVHAADDVIPLGMTVPLSGAGASWGLSAVWMARKAVKYVNDHGGVHVGGKTYKYSVTAYDNKYTAADGVKVAQTMLNRDGIRFIVFGLSTQAVAATQSISERLGVLLFTLSWSKAIKGPKFPMTFTITNTPVEFIGPLYDIVKKQNPSARTIALISPNDSADEEMEAVAAPTLKKLGYKVLDYVKYERGTTEFQPIATRIAQLKPDMVDTLGAPPGDIAVLYRALADQGWKGVRIASAGSVSNAVIRTGGSAIENLYMGGAADFTGPNATPLQRKLAAEYAPAMHQPLDLSGMSAWDAVMALKANMEQANSIDPRVVAKALPTTIFDSSYGPSSFGGASSYGTPQQMLLPVIITQIQNGKVVELARIPSAEMAQRLAQQKK
jgi:branched-chain amino acid transport system substrate-binding protein